MKKPSKKQNVSGKDYLEKLKKEDPAFYNLIKNSKEIDLNGHGDDSEENGEFSVDEDVSDDEEDSDVEDASDVEMEDGEEESDVEDIFDEDENNGTLEDDEEESEDENDGTLEDDGEESDDEDENNGTLENVEEESDVEDENDETQENSEEESDVEDENDGTREEEDSDVEDENDGTREEEDSDVEDENDGTLEEEDSDVEDENDETLENDDDESDVEDENDDTLECENGIESDVSMEEEDDSGGELSDEEDDDDSDGSLSGEEDKMSKILSKSGRAVEITLQLVEQWEKQLQEPKPLEAFLNISKGLMTSINSINCQEDTNKNFKVKSPDVFNKLVTVCLESVPEALCKMLKIRSLSLMSSSKKFKKLSPPIKTYVQNLIQLLHCVTDSKLKTVVLEKGILPIISCFKGQPKKGAEFVMDLIAIWSTGSQKLRVRAFVAIFRMVKLMNTKFLDFTLDKMYRAFTKNCRFTSQSNLGSIHLMRLSMCELYGLDKNLAYKHCFVHIRQLADVLRNAMSKKKSNMKYQTVYNWQFLHSLHLWCMMLSMNCPDEELDPLVHPLIELCLNSFKLQPTPRYHPLILHVSAMLTELGSRTGVFIPVLPLLMNVFTEVKPIKEVKDEKSKSTIIKTPNWDCTLKVSESESKCHTAMRSLLNKTMLQIVKYLASISHKINFAGLVMPAIINLKKSVKRKEPFCQGFIKQLYANATLQSDYIDDKKKHLAFQLEDVKKVADWENERKTESMPMVKFFESLEKQNDQSMLNVQKYESQDNFNQFSGKRMRDEDEGEQIEVIEAGRNETSKMRFKKHKKAKIEEPNQVIDNEVEEPKKINKKKNKKVKKKTEGNFFAQLDQPPKKRRNKKRNKKTVKTQ